MVLKSLVPVLQPETVSSVSWFWFQFFSQRPSCWCPSVSGRTAAGGGPAGVHQQGVSDWDDVRGGPERSDTHKTQVRPTRTFSFHTEEGPSPQKPMFVSCCRPDPTVEIAFIRPRSSSSSSSGSHSPVCPQGCGGGVQARGPGSGPPLQPAVVTKITSSRNPTCETLPPVNISQV